MANLKGTVAAISFFLSFFFRGGRGVEVGESKLVTFLTKNLFSNIKLLLEKKKKNKGSSEEEQTITSF